MNRTIFGEENCADICSILYVLSDAAEQMDGVELRAAGILCLAPGAEPECVAPGIEPNAPGAFVLVSLRSRPPLPEDGNVLARFFAAPSGFLLFRTGSDSFFRDDFLQILREGQERRPFHQEIIRSTLAQDFCLILRKYVGETAA